MNWLRRIFGRRPVDIAGRQLRKAERQLLEVEKDLEMTVAVRDYLVNHIARLDAVVKSEGMRRVNFRNEYPRRVPPNSSPTPPPRQGFVHPIPFGVNIEDFSLTLKNMADAVKSPPRNP